MRSNESGDAWKVIYFQSANGRGHNESGNVAEGEGVGSLVSISARDCHVAVIRANRLRPSIKKGLIFSVSVSSSTGICMYIHLGLCWQSLPSPHQTAHY